MRKLSGDAPVRNRDFESIIKIVEDFFGGATFSIVRKYPKPREVEQGDNFLVIFGARHIVRMPFNDLFYPGKSIHEIGDLSPSGKYSGLC